MGFRARPPNDLQSQYIGYEKQMLQPTEFHSYIISTSSNNSSIPGTQDVVKACEEWANSIVEKKS